MLDVRDPLLAWQIDEACALAGSLREQHQIRSQRSTSTSQVDEPSAAPHVRVVGSGHNQRKIVTHAVQWIEADTP